MEFIITIIVGLLCVLFLKWRNRNLKDPTSTSSSQRVSTCCDESRWFREGQTLKQCKTENCKYPGKYFCFTCVRLICENCVIFHYMQLSIRGHHVMSYKKYMKVKSQQDQTGINYDLWFCQKCKCLFTKQNTEKHTTHSADLARYLFPRLILTYCREFLLFADLIDEYTIELEKVSSDISQLPSNYEKEYNSILHHPHFRTELQDDLDEMMKNHFDSLEKNKNFLESKMRDLKEILAEFTELAVLSPFKLKARFKFPSIKPYSNLCLERVDYPKIICTENSLKFEQLITYQPKFPLPWFGNITFSLFLLKLIINICVLCLVLLLIALIMRIFHTRSLEIIGVEEKNEYMIESYIVPKIYSPIIKRPDLSVVMDRPGLLFPLISWSFMSCFLVLHWCWKCIQERKKNTLHNSDTTICLASH